MARNNVIIEKLQRGETVSYRGKGNSMTPRIISGALVTLASVDPEDVQVGDAVLAKVHGTVYLHLCTAKKDGRFQISNAHGHVNGWCGPNQIYGRLVRVDP